MRKQNSFSRWRETHNPSIELTHNGGPRLLASSTLAAPLCAAHVER